MKKPDCIIDNGEYEEPNVFESESESILFDAYLEQQKYIEYLESKVNDVVSDDVNEPFYCDIIEGEEGYRCKEQCMSCRSIEDKLTKQ